MPAATATAGTTEATRATSIAPPTALFLSPHLDDVAFSCGATLARLAARGWHCVLATAFTRSVAQPSGFALACQTDKGLPPELDYMRLRRDEDAAFARLVGVRALHWLDLPEAPHRGYASAAALFAPPRPDDAVVGPLASRLRALRVALRPRLVVAPLALGRHVDHVQLRRAVRGVLEPDTAVLWYRDTPYAMRTDRAATDRDSADSAHRADSADRADSSDVADTAMPLDAADLRAKLDGCACYRSQLGFQFGGVPAMRAALGAFADDEGRAAGLDMPAERFVLGAASAEARSTALVAGLRAACLSGPR